MDQTLAPIGPFLVTAIFGVLLHVQYLWFKNVGRYSQILSPDTFLLGLSFPRRIIEIFLDP